VVARRPAGLGDTVGQQRRGRRPLEPQQVQ
jgi:hypothetical protein